MPKIYKEQNVLDAALDRLRYVFERFEGVYFSVSGGKDSSVMVQLAERVAAELDRSYDVLYIDFEAQYARTIEHIEELKQLPHIGRFIMSRCLWRCAMPYRCYSPSGYAGMRVAGTCGCGSCRTMR